MEGTDLQFDKAKNFCIDLFSKKLKDYGPSWRILRTTSLTDQIFIKAQRIRNIELLGTQLIDDDVFSEFIGIVNYSAIGIIQLKLGNFDLEVPTEFELINHFVKVLEEAKTLMMKKNHDYGEAWREMRISSFTDMILVRIQRIRQIENNSGVTLVSEGIDANYYDIINYGIFSLIKLRIE
jgi:hypothetical protein